MLANYSSATSPHHTVQSHDSVTASAPASHDANPPSHPHTASIGIAGKSSPRSKRIVPSTPATSVKHYSQPDLRLLAMSKIPVPLKLLTIPPRPAVATPQHGTPGTPHSSVTAGSADSTGYKSRVASPFASDENSHNKGSYEPLAKLIDENAITRVAMDVLWADPASRETELTGGLDSNGFGAGIRGGDTFCFGEAAVDAFLAAYGFDMVIRAHQATAAGIELSASSKVCTVFSTSKDHGCGASATCGCLLIEHGTIHPIARSVCYDMSITPSAHKCSSHSTVSPAKRDTRPTAAGAYSCNACHVSTGTLTTHCYHVNVSAGTPKPSVAVSDTNDIASIRASPTTVKSPSRRVSSSTAESPSRQSVISSKVAPSTPSRQQLGVYSASTSTTSTHRQALVTLNANTYGSGNTSPEIHKRSSSMRSAISAVYASKYHSGTSTSTAGRGEYSMTEEKSDD